VPRGGWVLIAFKDLSNPIAKPAVGVFVFNHRWTQINTDLVWGMSLRARRSAIFVKTARTECRAPPSRFFYPCSSVSIRGLILSTPDFMHKNPSKKYRPFPPVSLPDRQWPNRVLTAPPRWCSVDLRDGNQALAVPMNVSQKLELFQTLVKIGFKEIEVGFPSASNTEFTFNRRLIEEKRAPDDVWLQVLVQAREDLIERTMESLVGAKKAIIHMYNSTSPAQRRVVFGKSKKEIKAIAVNGARMIKERLPRLKGTEVMLQYSPESFSATEHEFSKEISEAVMDVWQPTPERKMILNLPDTVEVAMPNVYADQIEWMCRNIKNRDSLLISLHTHNDRCTGVAATELGLLAGADRVEGTLFGNGERTGNLDIVTVALNLYQHGIDPKLDFSNLNSLIEVYERCTGMTIPARQPYAGELVFTAFSGSHQDAIKKGLAEWETRSGVGVHGSACPDRRKPELQQFWDVPYLTIDPTDIGREYREVIRVNSQSGKGGVAYLLESEFGIELPKDMQREFGPIANNAVDKLGREVSGAELKAMFWQEYVERVSPWQLKGFETESKNGVVKCRAKFLRDGKAVEFKGEGNGPLAALVHGFAQVGVARFEIANYSEHALSSGEGAAAIAYIQIKTADGKSRWGAGVDTNIELASVRAVLSALNRL
jgi:2-isopropylmalate synthase